MCILVGIQLLDQIIMNHLFNIEESELDAFMWRYMDFTKFIDLIENSSIFFPIVDLFEDKLEGVHNAIGENDFYDITNEGKFIRIDKPLDYRQEENSSKFKSFLSRLVEEIRTSVGISCWRISQHESHAMWKVFLNSNEGVAIKTTPKDFIESIQVQNDFQNTYLGKVKYIDYKNDKVPIDNMFNALFHKNIYFEHEKELRILLYEVNNNKKPTFDLRNLKAMTPPGVSVSLDYKKMIKEVVVSPYAPKWFFDLIKKLLVGKYELNVPINWSMIDLKK